MTPGTKVILLRDPLAFGIGRIVGTTRDGRLHVRFERKLRALTVHPQEVEDALWFLQGNGAVLTDGCLQQLLAD